MRFAAAFRAMSPTPRALLGNTGPEAADHSIGCEKCHGPGGNHLLAIAAKFPDLAIARPSLASGAARGEDLRPVSQPSRQNRLARRSQLGAFSGHDPDMEPLLYREQRRAGLRDLSRPSPQCRDVPVTL